MNARCSTIAVVAAGLTPEDISGIAKFKDFLIVGSDEATGPDGTENVYDGINVNTAEHIFGQPRLKQLL